MSQTIAHSRREYVGASDVPVISMADAALLGID
jgi:hypothetical protein